MPRLRTSLLRHARAINPLLPLLLRTCRTIPSAHNELRWLREHVNARLERRFGSAKDVPERLRHRCVAGLVRRRGSGEPLQYLLGGQPFGELDIKCARGVLIPRQCTEAYTERLARVIKEDIESLTTAPERVRIIDFCTGTGCIPLLLLSLLSKSMPNIQPDISGIDISPAALKLATRNYHHNISHFGDTSKRRIHTDLQPTTGYGDGPDFYDEGPSVIFENVDVLADWGEKSRIYGDDVWAYGESDKTFTIVTSNPPYISEQAFEKQTERSVRNYEPKLALVPNCTRLQWGYLWEDGFYGPIAERAEKLGARILLLEVAGTEQAVRVAKMVLQQGEYEGGLWEKCEIWGDEPDATEGGVEDLSAEEKREMEELGVGFRGAGMGRSVFFRRHELPAEVEGHGCFVSLREEKWETEERLQREQKMWEEWEKTEK